MRGFGSYARHEAGSLASPHLRVRPIGPASAGWRWNCEGVGSLPTPDGPMVLLAAP